MTERTAHPGAPERGTNGELRAWLYQYQDALDECNADKAAIRQLGEDLDQ